MNSNNPMATPVQGGAPIDSSVEVEDFMDFFDFDAYERDINGLTPLTRRSETSLRAIYLRDKKLTIVRSSPSFQAPADDGLNGGTSSSLSSPVVLEPQHQPATPTHSVPISPSFPFTFSVRSESVSQCEANSAALAVSASSSPGMTNVLHQFTGHAAFEQEQHSSWDEDVNLEVSCVAREGTKDDEIGEDAEMSEDVEMSEDAEMSEDEEMSAPEDTEMEDVGIADVLSAAVPRTDTLSPSESTLVRSPRKVPTSSPISEQGGHGCEDVQSGNDDEPSIAEVPGRAKGTQQSEHSSDAVSGSSEPTSSPQEAKELEEEAMAEESSKQAEEFSKEAKEPKWEVHRILASAILSDGLLYYRASWKGWGQPDYGMYPAHNFRDSPDRLLSFHRRYPKQPGPPMRLDI